MGGSKKYVCSQSPPLCLVSFLEQPNLNWEILTKNSVTFKRWDGVKDEKFEYYGGSLKNPDFRGSLEKPIYWGEFPKKGGLGQFADLRWWRLGEKEGG